MKNTSVVGQDLGKVDRNQFRKENRQSAQQVLPIANKRKNSYNHFPPLARVIAKVRAYFIVKGVKSALRDVDLIEKGLIKPKSLDQLLNEL
jgi:hypothetical protein